MYLKFVFPSLLQQFWKCLNDCTHMYKSLGLVMSFWLKVRITVTPEVLNWD